MSFFYKAVIIGVLLFVGYQSTSHITQKVFHFNVVENLASDDIGLPFEH